MKALLLFILVLCIQSLSAQTEGIKKGTYLTGTISDKNTHEPLVGTLVYFPDLKAGSLSMLNGKYRISNLPRGNFLVQVKYFGYKTYTGYINLVTDTIKDFLLEPSSIEIDEVVITGSAISTSNEQNSVAVSVVDRKSLLQLPSANIIDAISSIPGVSQISTGGAISKPVIRGLGFNRVVTLYEGIRQEGQAWGEEHGIELDEFSAEKIEILRGPSSLLYGSDAMGGVINFLDPVPAPGGTLKGEFNSKFGLNNKYSGNSLMLEGNNNGLIGRLRGTFKSAASYKTPAEYVYNSGFNEHDVSGMIGLNKRWGYSHLNFSSFTTDIGIVEGERDSITHQLLNSNSEIASPTQASSRRLALPKQNVQHHTITSINKFIIKNSQLALNIGYQNNIRKEYGEALSYPDLDFRLHTLLTDIKYYLPVWKNWTRVIGITGKRQDNVNEGNRFLIPVYKLYDAGGFFYVKKNWSKFTFNAGLRHDIRKVNGEKRDSLFPSFSKTFNATTGSVGATYHISEIFNLKGNIGRGFRAPTIPELVSNGVHEGSFKFEKGNLNLKPEYSLQFDAGITAESKYFSSELNAFYNQINNFIYIRNSNRETINSLNNTYLVYHYVQGLSVLRGFEFSFDVHPLENIHFENAVSYVEGKNISTLQNLPFIPPLKLRNDARWNIKNLPFTKRFKDSYILAGATTVLSQNRFDVFETATPGYIIFNAGVGTCIRIAAQHIALTVYMSNLANRKYYDPLSRLKYADIAGMGRNITFSVSVPFGIVK